MNGHLFRVRKHFFHHRCALRPIIKLVKLTRQRRLSVSRIRRNHRCWHTTAHACPESLISLNSPLLSSSTHLSFTNLIVAVLSDKPAGIMPMNRRTPQIILNNLNTNVAEVSEPPNRRLLEVQAQDTQRDR